MIGATEVAPRHHNTRYEPRETDDHFAVVIVELSTAVKVKAGGASSVMRHAAGDGRSVWRFARRRDVRPLAVPSLPNDDTSRRDQPSTRTSESVQTRMCHEDGESVKIVVAVKQVPIFDAQIEFGEAGTGYRSDLQPAFTSGARDRVAPIAAGRDTHVVP